MASRKVSIFKLFPSDSITLYRLRITIQIQIRGIRDFSATRIRILKERLKDQNHLKIIHLINHSSIQSLVWSIIQSWISSFRWLFSKLFIHISKILLKLIHSLPIFSNSFINSFSHFWIYLIHLFTLSSTLSNLTVYMTYVRKRAVPCVKKGGEGCRK